LTSTLEIACKGTIKRAKYQIFGAASAKKTNLFVELAESRQKCLKTINLSISEREQLRVRVQAIGTKSKLGLSCRKSKFF
jgi:predicted RNA-binding protein with RPS1 domain